MKTTAGSTRTALMMTESVVVANQLVEAGARVDIKTLHKGGWTFLMEVCFRGRLKMVEWLLPRLASLEDVLNVDISSQSQSKTFRKGDTALHIASSGADVRIVNALLRAGAVVDSFNARGCSPLHHACYYSDMATVNALVQWGADVNAINGDALSPLHFIAISAKQGTKKLSVLLAAGARIGVKNSDGETAAQTTINNDVRLLLNDEMWEQRHIHSIGPWRPGQHEFYPEPMKLCIRTVQILACARPRLSLNDLIMFRETRNLPSRYSNAYLHVLPEELRQYLFTFIASSPYPRSW